MAEADFRLMTEATGQRIAAALEALHLATVTGVKGDAEQNYRHGDVNLTPANIGAAPYYYIRNTADNRRLQFDYSGVNLWSYASGTWTIEKNIISNEGVIGGLHNYAGTTSSQWPIAVENEQEILLLVRIGANNSSNVYLSLTIPAKLIDATERQFATQGTFGMDVCSLLVKVTSTTITLDARVNGSSTAIYQTLIYGVR